MFKLGQTVYVVVQVITYFAQPEPAWGADEFRFLAGDEETYACVGGLHQIVFGERARVFATREEAERSCEKLKAEGA